MNILHLDTERTWRGGENQMRLLIEGLAAKNIHCHAVLDPRGEAVSRLAPISTVHLVKMHGGLDPIAAHKVAKICHEHKIHIINAHTSNAHLIAILVKLWLPKLKVVVHRRVDFPPKSGVLNRFKYLTPKVDAYVAISHAIGRIMTGYGISDSRLSVVLSAVDETVHSGLDRQIEREALVKSLGIDPTLPLIGNASAMTSQKGHEVLLQALKILQERGVRFHCVVAGDGPLRQSLEEQRVNLGIDKQLSFLGWIQEVPRFLAALDILAMPSILEGLGTVILEGVYSGCGIVASEVGGIPEMISHKKTGWLSPVGDALRLANNLQEAIEDPEIREAYTRSAQFHIRQRFSLERMVGGNLEVYRSLLEPD